jgi:hypothetical protein
MSTIYPRNLCNPFDLCLRDCLGIGCQNDACDANASFGSVLRGTLMWTTGSIPTITVEHVRVNLVYDTL